MVRLADGHMSVFPAALLSPVRVGGPEPSAVIIPAATAPFYKITTFTGRQLFCAVGGA